MDFLFGQSREFYVYMIIGLAWIIHIIASAYRLLTLFGNSDMRLNVRFVEKGKGPVIDKGKIIVQIIFSTIMVVCSAAALFLM